VNKRLLMPPLLLSLAMAGCAKQAMEVSVDESPEYPAPIQAEPTPGEVPPPELAEADPDEPMDIPVASIEEDEEFDWQEGQLAPPPPPAGRESRETIDSSLYLGGDEAAEADYEQYDAPTTASIERSRGPRVSLPAPRRDKADKQAANTQDSSGLDRAYQEAERKASEEGRRQSVAVGEAEKLKEKSGAAVSTEPSLIIIQGDTTDDDGDGLSDQGLFSEGEGDGAAGLGVSSGTIGGVAGGVAGGVVGGTLGGAAGAAVTGTATGTTTTSKDNVADAEGTEDYTDYGINDMTRVDRDRYSTFSIDVDTASYSIARRKLEEGRLPPTASVRVEEFINYFDYGYVAPTGDAPFAVNMEGAPHPFQRNHHILRFGVQGALPSQVERTPVHLTFLVDTSGSMDSTDKIGLVKRSLRYLVDNLETGDTVALATYAGSVRKVLAPTAVSQRDAIFSAIDNLDAGGSTAMDSGVDLAYQMASEAMVHGHENRVIVLSDGDANVGATSHEEILRTIKRYAEEGVTLSTIGFGMGNYQDTLMEQLADQGDGNYAYIDTFAEAEKVFGDDLAGTLQVIAKDVKIQVEFNPEAVMAYRLIGYENRDIADKDFRNDRVDAGEIGAGHTVTALYDVVLTDDYRDHDLGVVRLRNKKPGRDSAAVEWETLFPARLVSDEFADASGDFRLAFGAGFFAELLRGSPYTAEITYSDLLRVLTHKSAPIETELLNLIATAGQLSGENITLASRP
jgi:Ca-activated chloride channel family protein